MSDSETRTCIKCGLTKPSEDFRPTQGNSCKHCFAIYLRDRYRSRITPERKKEYNTARRIKKAIKGPSVPNKKIGELRAKTGKELKLIREASRIRNEIKSRSRSKIKPDFETFVDNETWILKPDYISFNLHGFPITSKEDLEEAMNMDHCIITEENKNK